MFNIMLDKLPSEFEGYLIRTDFRIGIQISQAIADVNLHDDEKIAVAANLLFGAGKPGMDKIVSGIKWFLAGGNIKEQGECGEVVCFDFEEDSGGIYTAFRARYGIDLARVSIHWFEFVSMLGDLGDCSLTNIIKIRVADTSKMSGEQKNEYLRLQRKYAIKPKLSDEEIAAIEDFENKLG